MHADHMMTIVVFIFRLVMRIRCLIGNLTAMRRSTVIARLLPTEQIRENNRNTENMSSLSHSVFGSMISHVLNTNTVIATSRSDIDKLSKSFSYGLMLAFFFNIIIASVRFNNTVMQLMIIRVSSSDFWASSSSILNFWASSPAKVTSLYFTNQVSISQISSVFHK